MLRPLLATLALLALLGTSACSLYWDNNHPPVCNNGLSGGVAVPANQQERDPQTGICATVGGGYPCDPQCGLCPEATGSLSPDWATCSGSCEALDESTCLATSGCRAAYFDDAGSGSTTTFRACWETAPSGPIEGGDCTTLDAYGCSRHDDCIALYSSSGPNFDRCAAEPVGNVCDRVDILCPNGAHCEQQCTSATCTPTCVADTTCDQTTCPAGETCIEQCTSGTCGPTCVTTSTSPGSCTGTVTCAVATPACPSGTVPGIDNGCYTGFCIPTWACGPGDPGTCWTGIGSITCNSAPPACPSDTDPGVINGCWSGYCIPQSACPLPACDSLATEAACTARTDCTAVYAGVDCTCTSAGCTCASETFARCQ